MADRPGLRVVFAEDHYLVREGTAALFAESAEVELVRLVARAERPVCPPAALFAESAEVELVRLVEDAQSLLAAVADLSPDAVLTDIRMPPTHTTEGITAAKRI